MFVWFELLWRLGYRRGLRTEVEGRVQVGRLPSCDACWGLAWHCCRAWFASNGRGVILVQGSHLGFAGTLALARKRFSAGPRALCTPPPLGAEQHRGVAACHQAACEGWGRISCDVLCSQKPRERLHTTQQQSLAFTMALTKKEQMPVVVTAPSCNRGMLGDKFLTRKGRQAGCIHRARRVQSPLLTVGREHDE